MQAQLSVHEEMVRCPSGKSSVKYQPNQQLEELRNLQAQLTQKKQAFQLEMEQEYKKIAEEHLKLNKSWVFIFFLFYLNIFELLKSWLISIYTYCIILYCQNQK